MKYTSDAIIGVSLTPQVAKPLDVRLVVDTVDELYAIPSEIAYEGMPVAHAKSGHIYVLTDKTNITKSTGWTASYETVQIVQCSESEYNERAANTENGKPIDESLPYLYDDVYYYISEDSITDKSQYYVSQAQFEAWEDTLAKKATITALEGQYTTLKAFIDSNTELINTNETSIKNILLSIEDVKKIFDGYYNIDKLNELFLKKSDIQSDSDEYIFVSKSTYEADKAQILADLANTIKTEGGGNLDNLTVTNLTVTTLKATSGKIGENDIATKNDIPNFIVISAADYAALENPSENTYYYITDSEDDDDDYVTKAYVESSLKSLSSQLQSKATTSYVSDEITKLQNLITSANTSIETNANAIKSLQDSQLTLDNLKKIFIIHSKDTETSIDSILSDYVTTSSLTTTLGNYLSAETLSTTLSNYVQANSDVTFTSVTIGQKKIVESDSRLQIDDIDIALKTDLFTYSVKTESEYEELVTNNTIDANMFYFITEN